MGLFDAYTNTATDEVALIRSGLTGKTKADFTDPTENCVHFAITKKDKVLTLILGSKPPIPAVLSYLEKMIALARENEKKYKIAYEKDLEEYKRTGAEGEEPTPPGKYYFFLYSGRPDGKDDLLGDRPNPMLRQIAEKLKETQLPENLNIIPFTFQTDEQLAPLMARSDATLTRSGGLTTMELLYLNREEKRVTLLHSEGMIHDKESAMHFVKKYFEIVVAYLFFFTMSIQDKLGHEIPPLLKNPEVKEILVQNMLAAYPNHSREELRQFIEDPLNKKHAFDWDKLESHLLRDILYDPLLKEDKLISKMLKLSMKKKEDTLLPCIKENKILSLTYEKILRKEVIQKLLNREGNVGHEIGNAKYLKKKIEAKLVSPSHCEDALRREFFTI